MNTRTSLYRVEQFVMCSIEATCLMNLSTKIINHTQMLLESPESQSTCLWRLLRVYVRRPIHLNNRYLNDRTRARNHLGPDSHNLLQAILHLSSCCFYHQPP